MFYIEAFEIKMHLFLLIFLLSVTANNTTFVECPDKSTCENSETCCKTDFGYGCCPYENAVCCKDKSHCCPSETKCDLKHGTCVPNSEKEFKKLNSVTKCGTSYCELPNAVCCEGFCCPENSMCSNIKKECIKKSTEIFQFLLNPPPHEIISKKQKCPDGRSLCQDNSTCCKIGSGKYGCCPFTSAVCCKGGKSCCPHNFSCSVEGDVCIPKLTFMEAVDFLPETLVANRKVVNIVNKAKNVKGICEDLQPCKSGQTCCPNLFDYGCCPLENAVCCDDKEHCCPNNTVCHVDQGICSDKFGNVHPMQKRPKMKNLYNDIYNLLTRDIKPATCPDSHRFQCQGSNMCCPSESDCRENQVSCLYLPRYKSCCSSESSKKNCCPAGTKCNKETELCERGMIIEEILESGETKEIGVGKDVCGKSNPFPCENENGETNCCPFKNAVCCKNQSGCCPEKSICDSDNRVCVVNGSRANQPMHIFNNLITLQDPIKCPGSNTTCPEHQKCCEGDDGFFCCKFKHGTCCKNSKTCCNRDHTCSADGKCVLREDSYDVNNVNRKFCPDKKTKCPFPNTCCKTDKGYSCCQYKKGVCCPGGQKCCKNGYNCDAQNNKCVKKNIYQDFLTFGHPYLYPKGPEHLTAANLVTKVCSDKRTKCSGTCCRDHNQHFRCCRFNDGVCCPDGRHCCAKGSRCDPKRKRCVHDRSNFYDLFNQGQNRFVETEKITMHSKGPKYFKIGDVFCNYLNCGQNNCCFTRDQGVGCCIEN